MECFLHIHNLHHTEQRGLAGLPCTYTLSQLGTCTHTHTNTHTCTGLPECIDKKGGGNNKRKGANSLLQPCHVRSIRQINPLLRRRWRSLTLPSRPLSFRGRMMTCQIRFPAVYVVVAWGLFRCAWPVGHCICKLDPCYRLAPRIVHA